jgi:hypothetical protein
MLTKKPSIVLAAAPKYSRRKKAAKPALNNPAIVTPQEANRLPSETTPTPAIQRIVQALKPGSKPYLSVNIPKAPADPDARSEGQGVPQEDDAEPSSTTG